MDRKIMNVRKRAIKKIACCVLAAGMAVSGFPARLFTETQLEAQAGESYTVGNSTYTYEVVGDTVTITGWSGTDTELVVPEEIDGKKVTRIGFLAFFDCSSLNSIELPSSLTSIESSAFSSCSSLSSIKLPPGLKHIESAAFFDCSSLNSIELPLSLKRIGLFAFAGCSSLNSIELPSGLTEISGSVFERCSNLSGIEVAVGNESYQSIDGVLFSKDGTKLIRYPAGKTEKNYIVPLEVTALDSFVFECCDSLSSIELPSGLTIIGNSAFYGCSSLSSIELPSGVTSIGSGLFCHCSNLSSIELPSGVTSIGGNVFSDCSSLSSIELPSGVTSIGWNAFSGCSSLSSIKLPLGLTSIEEGAFSDCNSLSNIELPSGVTSIERFAFGYLRNGSEYRKMDNFTIYGDTGSEAEIYARGNGFTFIAIGTPADNTATDGLVALTATAKELGNGMYGKVFDTESATVDISTNKIIIDEKSAEGGVGPGDSSGMRNTAYLYIPVSLAGSYIISADVTVNELVERTEGVTQQGVFVGVTLGTDKDSDMVSIAMRGDGKYNMYRKKADGTYNGSAGDTYTVGTKATLKLERHDDSMFYTTVNGATFKRTSDVNAVLKASALEGYVFIAVCGANVTIENLKITNEDGTVVYGEDTVYTYRLNENGDGICITKCETRLEKVVVPDEIDGKKVTSIGDSAFSFCRNLSSIELPPGLTSIGSFAFSSGLESIELPLSLRDISGDAFNDCYNLNGIEVAFGNKNYQSINGVLFSKDGTKLIKYPAGKTEKNYVVPSGVMAVEKYAFANCVNLSSIGLPSGLTSIGDSAFLYCTDMSSIELPSGVTSIGEYTFKNCRSLSSIKLPLGVTSIGSQAFIYCNSLSGIEIPESVTQIEKLALGYLGGSRKIDNFTIYGYTGSAAETYAKENGFTFIAITDDEVKVTIPGGLIGDAEEKQELPIILDEVKLTFDTGALISINHRHGNKELVMNYKVVKEVIKNEEMTDELYKTAQEVVDGGGKLMDFSLVDEDGNNVIFSTDESQGSVTVTVPYTAPVSANKVSVFYIAPDGTKTDMNGVYSPQDKTVTFTTSHFSYYAIEAETAEAILFGDANGDGDINSRDAVLLKKHLAGYKNLDINLEACDVNADGQVNSKDAVKLMKKLAGYDVVLGEE